MGSRRRRREKRRRRRKIRRKKKKKGKKWFYGDSGRCGSEGGGSKLPGPVLALLCSFPPLSLLCSPGPCVSRQPRLWDSDCSHRAKGCWGNFPAFPALDEAPVSGPSWCIMHQGCLQLTAPQPASTWKAMVLIKVDTFECPDTHTEKFTNQKVYFLGLSPEKSAGRNWNNLLAYKFSLTVSPRLFISVIENVSNVAKLTKSNSFDQKMNLARLSVCGSQGKGGKQTKRFNKWSIGERERENLQPGKSEACKNLHTQTLKWITGETNYVSHLNI